MGRFSGRKGKTKKGSEWEKEDPKRASEDRPSFSDREGSKKGKEFNF